MRAAIYCRVSTQEQLEHGLSLDFQEQTCRAAALKAGASAVEVFTDGGYTGTKLTRPALTALRSRLPEFSCVFVWKLDRLSRSVKGFADLMEEFAEAACGFVSVTEGVDYSGSSGRLMMHMLAAVAAFFADLNKERVRAALAHRAAQGLTHGKPPLGYKVTTPGGVIAPDPDTAPLLRQLFADYAHGASLVSLAQDLNARGVPTPQGAPYWGYTTIRRLLERRAYLGEVKHNGEWLPGQHEALVSRRTWNTVQARLLANRTIPSRSRKDSLAPLLVCGLCGGRLDRGSSGSHYHRYYCRAQLVKSVEHEKLGIPAEKLEAALWAYATWLWEYAGSDLEARAREEAAKTSTGEAGKLRRRVADLDRELGRVLRGYGKGTIPEDVFLDTTRPLQEEREDLVRRLDALPVAQDYRALLRQFAATPPAKAIAHLRTQPGDVQVTWLRKLIAQVIVQPGARIVIQHKGEWLPDYEMRLPRQYQPQRGIGRFVMPDDSERA